MGISGEQCSEVASGAFLQKLNKTYLTFEYANPEIYSGTGSLVIDYSIAISEQGYVSIGNQAVLKINTEELKQKLAANCAQPTNPTYISTDVSFQSIEANPLTLIIDVSTKEGSTCELRQGEVFRSEQEAYVTKQITGQQQQVIYQEVQTVNQPCVSLKTAAETAQYVFFGFLKLVVDGPGPKYDTYPSK